MALTRVLFSSGWDGRAKALTTEAFEALLLLMSEFSLHYLACKISHSKKWEVAVLMVKGLTCSRNKTPNISSCTACNTFKPGYLSMQCSMANSVPAPNLRVLCPRRVAVHHVKVKPRCAVLTMLKRLDKIRFRGPRTRDDFPDLAESPPASDTECSDDMQLKPRTALRDTEDLLRDPVSTECPFFSFPVFIPHIIPGFISFPFRSVSVSLFISLSLYVRLW